jgi:hypothetical protein
MRMQTPTGRCSQCDSLRRECSVTLGEYLRILAERNAARKRRDHDLVEAFEDIENEAIEKCQKTRQAIFDHEAAHILERVHSADEMEPAELLSL